MKLRNFKQLGTAAILTAVLALNSCQKEEVIAPKKPTTTVTPPADITAATFGRVDAMQNDLMKLAYALTDPNFNKAESILSCATITRDEVSMPHHAIIDYGAGCTDGDGVLRSGRVDVYYNFNTNTELRNNAGSAVNATFTSFTQGDITYDGTATLVNQGHGGDFHNVFEITVNASVIDAAASETVSVNGSNAFEFTRGYETSDRNDDALSVTGSLSGDINGQAYTAAITGSNPLIKYRMESCNEYYVKGEMVYTYASDPTEYIDYGDGTCDNLAVKTVNGNSETITL